MLCTKLGKHLFIWACPAFVYIEQTFSECLKEAPTLDLRFHLLIADGINEHRLNLSIDGD